MGKASICIYLAPMQPQDEHRGMLAGYNYNSRLMIRKCKLI